MAISPFLCLKKLRNHLILVVFFLTLGGCVTPPQKPDTADEVGKLRQEVQSLLSALEAGRIANEQDRARFAAMIQDQREMSAQQLQELKAEMFAAIKTQKQADVSVIERRIQDSLAAAPKPASPKPGPNELNIIRAELEKQQAQLEEQSRQLLALRESLAQLPFDRVRQELLGSVAVNEQKLRFEINKVSLRLSLNNLQSEARQKKCKQKFRFGEIETKLRAASSDAELAEIEGLIEQEKADLQGCAEPTPVSEAERNLTKKVEMVLKKAADLEKAASASLAELQKMRDELAALRAELEKNRFSDPRNRQTLLDRLNQMWDALILRIKQHPEQPPVVPPPASPPAPAQPVVVEPPPASPPAPEQPVVVEPPPVSPPAPEQPVVVEPPPVSPPAPKPSVVVEPPTEPKPAVPANTVEVNGWHIELTARSVASHGQADADCKRGNMALVPKEVLQSALKARKLEPLAEGQPGEWSASGKSGASREAYALRPDAQAPLIPKDTPLAYRCGKPR